MSLILSISTKRLDEIIKREVARGMRELDLYSIVAAKSPDHHKLPSKEAKNFDLDYKNMGLAVDYNIGQDEQIQLRDIRMAFPIRVLEYAKMHNNPFARPVGGLVHNWTRGNPSEIHCTLPDPVNIYLWQDENENWDGRINWKEEGISLNATLVKFVD